MAPTLGKLLSMIAACEDESGKLGLDSTRVLLGEARTRAAREMSEKEARQRVEVAAGKHDFDHPGAYGKCTRCGATRMSADSGECLMAGGHYGYVGDDNAEG